MWIISGVRLCVSNFTQFSFSFQNVTRAKKTGFSFKKMQFLQEKFQIFKTEKKNEISQFHKISATQLINNSFLLFYNTISNNKIPKTS